MFDNLFAFLCFSTTFQTAFIMYAVRLSHCFFLYVRKFPLDCDSIKLSASAFGCKHIKNPVKCINRVFGSW